MRKYYLLSLLICTTVLSGCATHKDWVATGGSRADATIKLSYEYFGLEDVQVSEQQAIELAKKRCNVWGYSGAEAFGGITNTCNRMGSFGCDAGIVTKEYQCIGQGNEITNKPVVQQPTSYNQQTLTPYYQSIPTPQPVQQPVQPVVEQTAPTYQTYPQPQTGQSGTDLRYCLSLVDNKAIAECVRKAKR